MKKNSIRAITILLIIGIVFSPFVGYSAYADTDFDKEDAIGRAAYEEKLKAAQERKSKMEQGRLEAEKLKEEYSQKKENIEQYIVELDSEMNEISLRLFDLQNEIERTEEELEQTRKEVEEAKRREEEQYETMKKRVKYVYENGTITFADVLLNSGSISDILNQAEYVAKIQEYDNSLLDRYEAAKEERIEHEAYLEASLEELKVMREQAELDQNTVSELIALKAAQIEELCEELNVTDELLFDYIEEISSSEMDIEAIKEEEIARQEDLERRRKEEEERRRREEEERRRREEEARKAAEEAAKLASQKKYDKEAIKGVVLTDETDPEHMIWPLPGDYSTFSRFGYRVAPIAGASTYHKGWDIGGEFGAPIVAVLAGTVTIAQLNNPSAGNYVRIDHGNGYVTSYCHCSRLLVSEGEYVQQGETIGLVGSTGVSTSPHLHFGILKDGDYIDPEPYIDKLIP